MSRTERDLYRYAGPLLPCAEPFMEMLLGGVRAEIARLLREQALMRVLDIGCGTGTLSRRLANVGLSPICMDRSPVMLARASRRAMQLPSYRIVQGDAARIPFPNGIFDAVVISLALHEMPPATRAAAWEEAFRVVRSGGRLLLFDYLRPAHAGLAARAYGAALHGLEWLGGLFSPETFAAYREFLAVGGLLGWLQARGAALVRLHRYCRDNLGLAMVLRP